MIKNEIKMLSDKEHVLKRPGMYVGSTSSETYERFLFGKFTKLNYVPAIVKLIEEIRDNAIDEAVRTNFKFANKISVSIQENSVVVEDNGRGIPQGLIVTPEGDQIPGAVAAWTKTKAGGNFGDDAERKTSGMNGVGSSLTNIFSKSFVGQTCDGETTMIVTCSDNMDTIDWKTRKGGKQGTKVTFTPDFSHFECESIGSVVEDIISDQMQTLAVVYPEIEFKFNGTRVQGNFKKYAKQYDEHVISAETQNVQFAIARSDDGFRHLSYVNAIHTKVGGAHIDYVTDELANELIPIINRKYKIEVNKARIKECITVLLFVKDMTNLRFDSQTKERLTSPMGEVKAHIDLDFKKLARQFMANETILMPIIEAVLARKLAAEKAAQTKANKAAAKAKVAKHIKANQYGKDDLETTLFLTEGDSAIGYLLTTRDRELQGGFPLRGKVMNTWGMAPVDIMKNRELFDICAITGLVLGEKAENMNYRNIAIMVDADPDGLGSIYPSLLAFFSNWPELFDQGRIRLCRSPIIIATKGKDVQWFYEMVEYEAVKESLKGYTIRYIKGLGSLTEDDYARVISQPKFDVVSLPENWKDDFEMLLGNDAQLRKTWMST